MSKSCDYLPVCMNKDCGNWCENQAHIKNHCTAYKNGAEVWPERQECVVSRLRARVVGYLNRRRQKLPHLRGEIDDMMCVFCMKEHRKEFDDELEKYGPDGPYFISEWLDTVCWGDPGGDSYGADRARCRDASGLDGVVTAWECGVFGWVRHFRSAPRR